jgi:hypothetical protein
MNNLVIVLFLIVLILLVKESMMDKYCYSNTEIGLLILFTLIICIIIYTRDNTVNNKDKNKKPIIKENFTNNDDIYGDINNRENVIKSNIMKMNSKLDETLVKLKNIPKDIYTISSDLVNVYKFIVIISKFFLKLGDKIDTIDDAKKEIKTIWDDTKMHREYISHRVKKNYELWDKCLVANDFNKRFNECKIAYEDTKKMENYFKNNYGKCMNYIHKQGGIMDIIGKIDMKIDDIKSKKHIEELETLIKDKN